MFFRRHWWAVLYSLILIAFTGYLALDTFVISQVYAVVPEADGETESASASSVEQGDTANSAEQGAASSSVVEERPFLCRGLILFLGESISLSSRRHRLTALPRNKSRKELHWKEKSAIIVSRKRCERKVNPVSPAMGHLPYQGSGEFQKGNRRKAQLAAALGM